MLTELNPPISFVEFFELIRTETPAEQDFLVVRLEELFDGLKNHSQAKLVGDELQIPQGQKEKFDLETKIVISMVADAGMTLMFPEGIDEKIGKEVATICKISSLMDLRNNMENLAEDEKSKVYWAFMMHSALLEKGILDIADILERDYNVKDIELLASLSRSADSEVRWRYNGNLESFFFDLNQKKLSGATDAKKMISDVIGDNSLKSWAKRGGQFLSDIAPHLEQPKFHH